MQGKLVCSQVRVSHVRVFQNCSFSSKQSAGDFSIYVNFNKYLQIFHVIRRVIHNRVVIQRRVYKLRAIINISPITDHSSHMWINAGLRIEVIPSTIQNSNIVALNR